MTPHTPQNARPAKRLRWFVRKSGRALKLTVLAITIDVRHVWKWLLWALICVAVAAGIVYLVPSSTGSPGGLFEARARVTGLLLQLLGIWTVASGLRDKAKHHGKPGLTAPMRDRLRAAGKELASAFRGPQVVRLTASAISTGAPTIGRATLRTSAPPGATQEERIALLERKADELQENTEKLERDIDNKHKEALGAVEEEREARTADTEAVREEVAQVDTGALHIEWMGVWWLVLGVILSSMSPELAGAWYGR